MRLKELEEKYEKLLEELEAQMKELKQNCIEEDCKRLRTKKNELYWFISSDGIIGSSHEENDSVDEIRYRIGNYFKTREEAKEAVKKMKIYTRLKDLALKLNNGEKIDWENTKQAKYFIGCDNSCKKIYTNYIYYNKYMGQIYCLDENFLDIAKQEIGKENLKKLFE